MMNIKKILIRNSNFFGDTLSIDFSSKMNCIMGSRGTGKTTILSMIFWALNLDENIAKETLVVVKANLGSGSVEITVEDEQENQFIVLKTYGDAPTVKNALDTVVPYEDFITQFGVDFFQAGAIERIGIDPKQRLRLFDNYIGNSVSEANEKIGIVVAQLRQNEIQIKTSKREALKIKEELQSFGGIDEEMVKVKAEFAAANADDKLKTQFELENKKQTKRALEQELFVKIREVNHAVVQSIDRLKATLNSGENLLLTTGDLDSPAVKDFIKKSLSKFDSLTKLVAEISKLSNELALDFTSILKISREEHEKAEGAFSALKQTIAKHRELFQKLNNLSQKSTAKKIALDKSKALADQLERLLAARRKLSTELNSALASRAEIRRQHAAHLNSSLGQKVKILMKECSLNESFEEILRTHLSNFQMRVTGAERRILEASSPQALAASIDSGDAEGYAKRCEILDVERIKTLFRQFKETEIVFDLEACICEDAPNFYLAVEDSKKAEAFKPTEELSTGQRCTAVLPIIFAMTNMPLLIDQPEDNLDNRYITQSIHEIIKKVKENRQLLFVTHNPNIPVISDSEGNTFLSYRDQQSQVIAAGDVQAVKSQIIDLLEGGEKAFVTRKQIYGY